MTTALAPSQPADLIRDELEQVEEVLRRASISEVEVLQEAALHILNAGGKRVRPQMTLLAAMAAGGTAASAVSVAAACELIHTATLVHDDIVDESDSRRGRTAVQFYYGNSASVLMGDYLVVRAFGLVAEDHDPRIWRILVDTITRMCEGEVLQICVKGDTGLQVEVYETVIECKTAVLMAACTRLGALVAGRGDEAAGALADFGYHLGMAFQVQDDVLDYIGEERTLGKPVGGDLREGKVTLPVIYALENSQALAREELVELYGRTGPLSVAEIRRATQLISTAGGFERARNHARGFIRAAHEDLARLPASPAREALRSLASQIVERDR